MIMTASVHGLCGPSFTCMDEVFDRHKVDDDLALVNPWGISVADIAVPTYIWHGSEDLFVPFVHSEWLARTVPKPGPTSSQAKATCPSP